jgi:hypothetical protein
MPNQQYNDNDKDSRVQHYFDRLSPADFCSMAAEWQRYADRHAATLLQRKRLKEIVKNSICQADLDRVKDDDDLSWGPSAEAVWNNSYRIIDELSADDVAKHLTLWDSIRSLDLHTCDKEHMTCMGYYQGICWDLEDRLVILGPR